MSAVLTSRVSQLLYAETPHLTFVEVVGDLHTALAAPRLIAPILAWDCDDIAILDFTAGRVVLGFSDNLSGAHRACLTIAAGSAASPDAPDLTPADQDLLCRAITERLERLYPCDSRLDRSVDQPLTPDLIDQLVEALGPDIDGAPVEFGEIVQPPPPLSAENDVDRLMSRLSKELVTRTPSLISRAIASASPPDAPSQSANSATSAKEAAPDRHFWPRPLFVRRKTQETPSTVAAPAPHIGVSGELKAVRDALYAPDQASRSTPTKRVGVRIATQTKRALEVLASLPVGLASNPSNLKRKQSADDQIRN